MIAAELAMYGVVEWIPLPLTSACAPTAMTLSRLKKIQIYGLYQGVQNES